MFRTRCRCVGGLLARTALRVGSAQRAGYALLVAVATVAPAPVRAQDVEEILSYAVDISVRSGGSMLVTESIRVRALGREIRRGIYRDFPTGFPRWAGLGRIEAPFEVRSVRRDGAAEPYTLASIGGPLGRGGVQIRIGREDVFLQPGVHAYEITYETDRWVSFGESRDRLFWNVTGNGWGFTIREASATVRVQGLRSSPALRAWTGPEGSNEQAAVASWDPGSGVARFATTRPLSPREGLTIDVSFPSGQLASPTPEQTAAWFSLDWGGYIGAGYVVLLVIAVYLLMWRRVGVDPPAGPGTLRYEPPEGFSPAALGFLERRGYDVSQLAAALVSMAMKGAIRIERDDDSWTLHRIGTATALAPEERAIYQELLGTRDRITLSQAQHATLRRATKALDAQLSAQLERDYFVTNRRWFLAGLVVSLVGLGALAWRWRFAIDPVALFLCVWLAGWTAGVASLAVRLGQCVRAVRADGPPGAWGGLIFLSIFSLPFFAAELFVTGLLITMVPGHLVLATIAVGATNVVFYHLLERPTLRGRGVLDQLDGFRSYLTGDAERRLATAAGDGADVFARFLPHAIALGLEERWADGFGAALRTSSHRDAHAVPYPWYHHRGPGDGGYDASTFAASLGSSLASTLSSSSSPPSSGGGSGGGSSGGGGGGGGGGGW